MAQQPNTGSFEDWIAGRTDRPTIYYTPKERSTRPCQDIQLPSARSWSRSDGDHQSVTVQAVKSNGGWIDIRVSLNGTRLCSLGLPAAGVFEDLFVDIPRIQRCTKELREDF